MSSISCVLFVFRTTCYIYDSRRSDVLLYKTTTEVVVVNMCVGRRTFCDDDSAPFRSSETHAYSNLFSPVPKLYSSKVNISENWSAFETTLSCLLLLISSVSPSDPPVDTAVSGALPTVLRLQRCPNSNRLHKLNSPRSLQHNPHSNPHFNPLRMIPFFVSHK